MSEQQKAIFEHFARAKGYYQRNEIERGLAAFVMGMKSFHENRVVGREKLEFDNYVMEMVQVFSRVEDIANNCGEIVFEKGKEKALLLNLARCLKALQDARQRENIDQTRERKLALDKAITRGDKLLKAGKINEAKEQFQEALELYVDEHAIFQVIGSRFLAVEQPAEALQYLKRGQDAQPGDLQTLLLTARAHELLKDYDKALSFWQQVIDQGGEDSNRLTKVAELQARLKHFDDARQTAQRAYDMDNTQLKAKRLLDKLNR